MRHPSNMHPGHLTCPHRARDGGGVDSWEGTPCPHRARAGGGVDSWEGTPCPHRARAGGGVDSWDNVDFAVFFLKVIAWN